MMQALALIPEKLRQRRRIRQRVLDPDSPRSAFSNPKYGSTSRNFIFRVMATRKITPAPLLVTPPYQEMQEEPVEQQADQPSTSSEASNIELAVYSPKPETPCQKIYQRACAKLQVLPSMSVYEHLPCSQMVLPHSGVNQDDVKAIAIALVHNHSVHTLNMADNRLGSEGTAFITEALRENRSLADLFCSSNGVWALVQTMPPHHTFREHPIQNEDAQKEVSQVGIQPMKSNLSNNGLGTEGARLVAGALLCNTSIIRINISGNNIQDKDLMFIGDMLEKNKTLRELNLSHNHICHLGGSLLGQALEINGTLRTLDVSWNHLRLRGAVAFCNGVAVNEGLTRLHLAWNGLAMEGCVELSKALTTNTHLVELDVSANRVSGVACRRLLEGLRTNTTLRCLRIGNNPITTDSALSILLVLADDVTGLTELDLTDVSVDTNFLQVLQSVQEKRPLAVTHGVPLRHDENTSGKGPVVMDTDDPVTILFEFMRQKNLRLIDLLHSLDKDHSETLTREELRNGLLEIDIPLSIRSMDILMEKLDLNHDGVVDYEELAIGLKDYLRRTAKWKRRAEQRSHSPVFSRLQQLRAAIRMRIEASQLRNST